MKCVVTGGAGFIGSHLTDFLLEEGARVDVIDNFVTGRVSNLNWASRQSGFDLHELDVASHRAAARIETLQPDVIFLLAAQMSVKVSMGDPALDAKSNVHGLLNMLLAAGRAGVRKVVFAASGGTLYGELSATELPASEPKAETSSPPSSFYGLTKRLGVNYVRLFQEHRGLPGISLALGNVYGPRQDPHGEAGVVAIFADAMREGRRCRINGTGRATRDYVHVSDVVRAFVAAGNNEGSGLINVGTGVETSVLTVFDTLRRHFPGAPPPLYGPALPGEVSRIALAPERAQQQLGWCAQIGFDAGIRTTLRDREA